MAQKNLQTGASYTPLAEKLDPRTTDLRTFIEAHANTLTSEDGKKAFISAFSGKTQFAPIFKEYLKRPAIDFVETFADDETNPLVKVYEKNEKVNPRRDMYSRVGAIEFHIKDQLTRAGVLNELFPEGMPMATDRVVRPDKPKAKARRYSYNPGLMGEWLTKLDEYGRNNPEDLGIVKALAAQAHMGLRTGEIMNAPASAFVPPEKRSAAWGFFLDTDTPGVKMDENLNIAVGPRTYNILQQALDVSPANDRNLFVNPDGSAIGKGEMTRVAKLIKVPGIMTDELTGKKLDNLQEAYDLRRMWVTLALNEFPGQGDRVGAAQGRAIGAVTKGGGAVKEYYSPSRGFYGKEATTVPNAMDAWLFEAQTEELPPAPKGQRISYSTDFITGGPIFEPEDAPITMGSLTAKFVVPKPKTKVIRPEGPGIEPKPSGTPPVASSVKVTTDAAEGGISPELLEKLKKNPKQLENYLNMLEAKGVDVSQYRNSSMIATILSTLKTGAEDLKSLIPPAVVTGAAYALSGAEKVAAGVLPVIGFEGTRQEMLERGASPKEAIAQATAEELSGPMSIIGPVSRGLADAAVAGAEAGLEEQYGYKGPVTLEAIDKIGAGFISGGRFKFPNFASGGFIEKKGD